MSLWWLVAWYGMAGVPMVTAPSVGSCRSVIEGAPRALVGSIRAQYEVIQRPEADIVIYTVAGPDSGICSRELERVPAGSPAPAVCLTAKGTGYPDAVGGTGGLVHTTWLRLNEQRSFEIQYARLNTRERSWSEPVTFPGGQLDNLPGIVRGEGDALFIWYWNRPAQGEWGKIFLHRSLDDGRSWETLDPNFPAFEKKGEAAYPRLAVAGKHLYLIWLDQSPGGQRVVCNVSSDQGRTWLQRPQVVDSRPEVGKSDPRIMIRGKALQAIWTVQLLEAKGSRFEMWTASSSDGRDWGADRCIYSNSVTSLTYSPFRNGDDLACAWVEVDREGRPALKVMTDLDEAAEPVLLASAGRGSMFGDLSVDAGGSEALILLSESRTEQRGRVLGYIRRGEVDSWHSFEVEDSESSSNLVSPIGLRDTDLLYTVFLQRSHRRRFLMEPARSDSDLLVCPVTFESSLDLR